VRECFCHFTPKRQPLRLTADEKKRLEALQAAILLDLADGNSANAVARSNGVNRHTVALCAAKYFQFGLEAARGDLPRPRKLRQIPDDAIAWVLHCACIKPKELRAT
jgi:hypothetical protein